MNRYKEYINKMIDKNKDKIKKFGTDIYKNPEMGFSESDTHDKVLKVFNELGLKVESNLAITGVKATLHGKYEGPTLAILGEMDGLQCPEHPFSNTETDAAHICGHHAQLTAMVGASLALVNSKIQNKLHGNIVFMATPAEEYVEIEKRKQLKKENKLVYLAGKPELIRIGAFDDIDLSLITHVGTDILNTRFGLGGSANGFISKNVQFIGKSSHAGGAPEKGRNALQAANIALNGINAWRESFNDEENIRVHPIITKGGSHVNIVPDTVNMKTYVRAKTLDSIIDTNKKINQTLKAGALAMGCKVVIEDTPGFLPQKSSKKLVEVIRENANLLVNKEQIVNNGHFKGSSDMGDITSLMPGTIIEVGGVKGAPHTKEFDIVDKDAAYVEPARLLAMTAIDLMVNKTYKTKDIIESYQPNLKKSDYIKLVESFFKEDTYDYFTF